MTKIEYSYCPIRYTHDPTSGERLNVGVVLYAPSTGEVVLRYDHTYSRLSETFANFEGDEYRQLMQSLEFGIAKLSKRHSDNLFVAETRAGLPNAGSVIRRFWPDQGLSYQVGDSLVGLTTDLTTEAELVFDRFVTSQYSRDRDHVRRTDEDVWKEFKPILQRAKVFSKLRSVRLGKNSEEFKYGFKNGRWHVFEPVSLDYAEWTTMRNHINTLAGKAWRVHELSDELTIYVMVGGPRRDSVRGKYREAITMLRELPVKSDVIEESQVEQFAERIAGLVH